MFTEYIADFVAAAAASEGRQRSLMGDVAAAAAAAAAVQQLSTSASVEHEQPTNIGGHRNNPNIKMEPMQLIIDDECRKQ